MQPILVFDSGVGGLSVLEEVRKSLPYHDFVYLFDNARLPYGELDEQTLSEGAVELITKTVEQRKPVMVIIACNTASTLILPELRKRVSIPVVGVVPAIKPASKQTKTKNIALLATPATIDRPYTKALITAYANECTVKLLSSSKLVQMAELKLCGQSINLNELYQIVKPIINTDIDILVLGCTHFPLLKEELTEVLGNKIKLLDSGEAIANRVAFLLKADDAKSNIQGKSYITGIHTTDSITDSLKRSLQQKGFTDIISHQ